MGWFARVFKAEPKAKPAEKKEPRPHGYYHEWWTHDAEFADAMVAVDRERLRRKYENLASARRHQRRRDR